MMMVMVMMILVMMMHKVCCEAKHWTPFFCVKENPKFVFKKDCNIWYGLNITL
jgi:hypothetical protein